MLSSDENLNTNLENFFDYNVIGIYETMFCDRSTICSNSTICQ